MNSHRTSGRSAERRTIFVFALTAVAGVLVVGAALGYVLHRHELAQARTHLAGRVRALAEFAESEMIEAQRDIEFMSRTPAFRQLLHVDRVDPAIRGVPEDVEVEKRQLLAELMRKAERFSVLYLVQTNGDIYLLHPFAVQTNLTRFNLADRPYYQEAARTKQPVVSDSFLGADGILAVVILVPIRNNAGEAVVYLGAAFHLTKLSQLLTKERITPFDAGFMVDRQGHLIAHTNTRMLEGDARERFAKSPFVSEVLRLAPGAGTEGTPSGHIGECVDPADGKCYMTARIPMRSGWSVGLMRDRDGIAAEARSVVWRITLLTALLFLMVCAIGVAAAHRIGRSWDAAERALRASEEKYRNLFEGSLDAIVVASAETGTIIDCNRAATLLWGREKSELVGQHQRMLHPPGGGEGEFSRTFQEHLREREGQVLAAQIVTKSGEIRDVEIMANFCGLAGQRLIQGVFRDITERKQVEEALARHAKELAQFNAAAVGRELRMVELKEQVNELARQLGQPPPYEMESLNDAVQTTAPEIEGTVSGNPKSPTNNPGSAA